MKIDLNLNMDEHQQKAISREKNKALSKVLKLVDHHWPIAEDGAQDEKAEALKSQIMEMFDQVVPDDLKDNPLKYTNTPFAFTKEYEDACKAKGISIPLRSYDIYGTPPAKPPK